MTESRRRSLVLPVPMRQELKTPLGRLLKGEPSETVEALKEYVQKRKPAAFAVVGDFTTKNILDAGLHPDIYVVDHRVMRVEVDPLNHGEREVFTSDNPAGTISAES